MYRRILVPVDGSDTSKLGLQEAFKLAEPDRTRLRVLNVVDENMIPASSPVPLGGNAELVAALKATGERALKDAAAAGVRKHVHAECTQRLSGDRRVSDVILAEAKSWRADVIVMGTHGRRGLNRLLLGSDAERVLREAPVPVLLVRAENGRRRTAKSRG